MTATSEAAPTRGRQLSPLNPIEQLRAGRLPRRLVQLYLGLTLYGASMGLMIQGYLGLDPWDVLHAGITKHLDMSFGTVVIAVSFLVLLAWIPLRQWPGLGTISNAIVIGLVTDLTLSTVDRPDELWLRTVFMLAGVVVNALAGALYIGAQFGPGPRDGLMTGLVRRTGLSVRLVRTSIEVTVLAIGFAMGGVVGIGTVAYALAIGPLVHVLLPLFTVKLPDRS
ncbi:YczE/YyaS/YitT family protein [Kribbella catacumbae]|uniref:membrane protein YczE n=1 Tax=Kribbella catacumbae TaxID=460086 RepID=UPI000380AD7A|nr:membrane protein [Kribbella catacumbae]